MPSSLGWKRFDHYSIVTKDADKMLEFNRRLFGLEEAEVIEEVLLEDAVFDHTELLATLGPRALPR